MPPRVLESHRFYADWEQDECSTSRFLAAHGHPMAAAYRQARALFDGLAYACNAGARFYAFEDESNYAQYWAPGLTLSWEPSWRGFGSVYPAQGERWDAYLRAAAEAGYPEATRPVGDLGRWIVHLSGEEDRQAFQGHLARVQLGAFDFTCSTLEQLHAVRAAVDAVLGNWVLPPRTPEMDCGCGRSVTGLRGRPKRHPECQRARREEADRTLRALFAEARGPGHMATVIGLPIATVRADLERLGLVRREEDNVYARPKWWNQRLRTWGWPAWRAIAEAGLSRNAARVDELLDRFGIAELARPTRGRPIRFPQLQDRASVADLLRRHAGSFTAAAAELGCRPDRVAQAAHLFSLAPVRRRRCATRAASGGPERHAASAWRERIESGATPDDLVRESGLDEAEVLSRLRAEGLEDRAWVNLARRERSARTAA